MYPSARGSSSPPAAKRQVTFQPDNSSIKASALTPRQPTQSNDHRKSASVNYLDNVTDMVKHMAALNSTFAAATSHLPPASAHLADTYPSPSPSPLTYQEQAFADAHLPSHYEIAAEPTHNHANAYSNDDEDYNPYDNDDAYHDAIDYSYGDDYVDVANEINEHRWRWPPESSHSPDA